MNLSWTLSRYLARQFLTVVLITFGIFISLIYILELVELLRRGSGKPGVTFDLLALMALMEVPRNGSRTLPFAFLFGGMAAFLRLSRNNELVIARAAGVSVWQFIAPALAVAFAMGAFIVTVYGDVVVPRGGVLWTGTLIEVCERVGISESLVRTAVSRLVAAHRLRGERLGRHSY